MTVNELTGTMSWRTLTPGGAGRRGRTDRSATPAGPRGAAPIPTPPAAVRAAVDVHVESLGAGELQHHLARVGALRSRVAADVALGGRVPAVVAARMRSVSTPAAAHALTAERTDAVRELGRKAPAARLVTPVAAPARPPAAPPPGPRR
ncbi:hypothetical protein [Streptomyces sp. 142MFCol3.1]|uniref:hypothetical protein n=1 Tax=Streptomyces sp. 142MFCol3.1 TaxID=1172179 RepID=UPI000688E8EF|nr:hypothetical protein [Streptomyces sp. 142MFCol3.1]